MPAIHYEMLSMIDGLLFRCVSCCERRQGHPAALSKKAEADDIMLRSLEHLVREIAVAVAANDNKMNWLMEELVISIDGSRSKAIKQNCCVDNLVRLATVPEAPVDLTLLWTVLLAVFLALLLAVRWSGSLSPPNSKEGRESCEAFCQWHSQLCPSNR